MFSIVPDKKINTMLVRTHQEAYGAKASAKKAHCQVTIITTKPFSPWQVGVG
jgi:hypothetical protein